MKVIWCLIVLLARLLVRLLVMTPQEALLDVNWMKLITQKQQKEYKS
jgi:hypothetical protein